MAKAKKEKTSFEPMLYEATASTAMASTSRRNIAANLERTDRFQNIHDGLVPFKNSSTTYGSGNSSVDVRDAVVLCQKCYYNFAIFRNIIDLMTEFSVSDIYFRGGNEKSQKFFKGLFNKINILELQDKFFREYYRSGNVFIYRYDAKIKPNDVMRITQVFGEKGTVVQDPKLVEDMVIPSRYIILNPADIQMVGAANFGSGLYYKILTDYEIFQLTNPKTDEDEAVLKSLPPRIQSRIKNKEKGIIIPLDVNKISAVFYKKQDYEPFAVPMGYPVLEDINAKYEMKKIDMAVARTMQQWILLVTIGMETKDGDYLVNEKNRLALENLFKNQSVGRTLVADFTTKASFVIPDVADFFNPQKYEIINHDINVGLNNIFVSDEKFANQAQKVDIFIARLEQGRRAFLNNFLLPEIKRIAEAVNFQNFPTPYFEDIALKDNIDYAKIYARLVEVGALTAEQGVKAIQSNILPDPSNVEADQSKYKAMRDKGLYEPLVGGGTKGEEGKPPGTKQPNKKVSRIGASEIKYSGAKIRDGLVKMQELEGEVAEKLKSIHKIKKLSKLQKSVAEQITKLIVINEEPEKWSESIASYSESPIDKNLDRVSQVMELATEHQVEDYIAALLLVSEIKEPPQNG